MARYNFPVAKISTRKVRGCDQTTILLNTEANRLFKNKRATLCADGGEIALREATEMANNGLPINQQNGLGVIFASNKELERLTGHWKLTEENGEYLFEKI
jgi:hypothetical protein